MNIKILDEVSQSYICGGGTCIYGGHFNDSVSLLRWKAHGISESQCESECCIWNPRGNYWFNGELNDCNRYTKNVTQYVISIGAAVLGAVAAIVKIVI